MNSAGIDYYPFNVDFFSDDKIQLIEAEFGIKGSYIAVRLLCKIYYEGYYYQWGDDECLLFSKNLGNGIVPNMIKEVVSGLVKRSFFDKRVFDSFGIITSRGIQIRYFEAAKRRKRIDVIRDYLLVDTSKYLNVNIIGINDNILPQNDNISTQSKVEYSREKESTEKSPQEEIVRGGNFFDSINPPNDGILRNWDRLKEILKSYNCSEKDFRTLTALSNFGLIGHPIWSFIAEVRDSKGKINLPVRFILSKLSK